MTNNNNTKPNNCACGAMTCEAFVAGNQCFRCEQVDNRKTGTTFTDEICEWEAWWRQGDKRIADHKNSPDFIPATEPPLSVHEAVDLYW